MKILSLLQPWATLLVRGHKMVETRSWPTKYRGPVFIHASGSLNKRYKDSQMTPALQCLEDAFKDHIKVDELRFGEIVGMVEIVTTVRTQDLKPFLTPQEIAFGDYGKGRWAWECRNPVEFKYTTPCKGQLGVRDFTGKTNCGLCDSGYIPDRSFHRGDVFQIPCWNIIPKNTLSLPRDIFCDKDGNLVKPINYVNIVESEKRSFDYYNTNGTQNYLVFNDWSVLYNNVPAHVHEAYHNEATGLNNKIYYRPVSGENIYDADKMHHIRIDEACCWKTPVSPEEREAKKALWDKHYKSYNLPYID